MSTESRSRQGRPPKYPWELWTNGATHNLKRGRDFDAELHSFRTMVHRKARLIGDQLGEYGAYTHINEADQSVKIRFYRRDEI